MEGGGFRGRRAATAAALLRLSPLLLLLTPPNCSIVLDIAALPACTHHLVKWKRDSIDEAIVSIILIVASAQRAAEADAAVGHLSESRLEGV